MDDGIAGIRDLCFVADDEGPGQEQSLPLLFKLCLVGIGVDRDTFVAGSGAVECAGGACRQFLYQGDRCAVRHCVQILQIAGAALLA